MARRPPQARRGAFALAGDGPSPPASRRQGCSYRGRSPPPFHGLEEGVSVVEFDAGQELASLSPPAKTVSSPLWPATQVAPERRLDDLTERHPLLRGSLLGLEEERVAYLEGGSHA